MSETKIRPLPWYLRAAGVAATIILAAIWGRDKFRELVRNCEIGL